MVNSLEALPQGIESLSLADEKTLALRTDEDEVVILEHLIESTQNRLLVQSRLKDLMIQLKDQKERFIRGEESKQYALQMVKTAREVLKVIQEERIESMFSSDYIEELKVFAAIASKSSSSGS
jgi:hypothetical protein